MNMMAFLGLNDQGSLFFAGLVLMVCIVWMVVMVFNQNKDRWLK